MEVINDKPKKLFRSRSGAIGGVCSGLADYLNMDVTIIRVVAVITGVFACGGVLAYLLLWILIPLEPLYLEQNNGRKYE